MGLLKRKEEKSGIISVRVPGSTIAEYNELRPRAAAGGFDLASTMSDALVRIIKQIGTELNDTSSNGPDASRGLRQRPSATASPINGTSAS